MRLLTYLSLIITPLFALEEPEYEVLSTHEAIEIRRYRPYLVAEVLLPGTFDEVGNDAFRILVDYIGGDNRSATEIEMTAPVTQQGMEIEMTAPVAQQAADSGYFRIHFVMPGRFTLATLPQPNDTRIQLREVPGQTMVVIRYSGFWSEENYREHESELLAFIADEKLTMRGAPVYARYNSPFMPWFLRRNEIMIAISPPDDGS
jgi:hypothetical protein